MSIWTASQPGDVYELNFETTTTFNSVILKEHGINKGEPGNCRKFSIEALIGETWMKIHGSDVIGFYRMCVTEKTTASAVRIIIEDIAKGETVQLSDVYIEEMPPVKKPFRVVGYYHPKAFDETGFNGDIDQFDAVTDVIYIGFMPVVAGKNGIEISMDANTATHINTLKSAIGDKNVNIYASLTGLNVLTDNDDDIERIASQAADFVKEFDLHGMDLDLEGDWFTRRVDRCGYSKLIINLGKKLHDMGKKISIAVIPAYPFTAQALTTLDYINTMTYDYTDIDCWHSVYSAVLRDIDILCEKGLELIDDDGNFTDNRGTVPFEKVNVGMPFYGMGNIGGIREWERTFSFGEYYKPGDEDTFDPHCNYNTENKSYYNGPTTIRDKTAYALKTVGGVMFWALNHDVKYAAPYALLKVVAGVVV